MAGPVDDPLATVVVISWNGAHLLPDCLDAVAAQSVSGGLATWVVDNGSADGTSELVRGRYPAVRLVQTGSNLGFAGGNNAALRQVASPFVILLNNDARPRPGALAALVDTLLAPGAERVGAVTAKLLLPDGRLNNAGGIVYRDGYGADRGLRDDDDGRWDTADEVFAFCGAAVALRTAALDDAGLFDEDFFLYYEDTDLSWRLRARGWSVRYQPAAAVDHLHSATTDQTSDLFAFHNLRNRLLLLTKNAQATTVARALLRYAVTTSSRAGRDLPRRRTDRVRLQVHAAASYLRLLPRALHARRATGRTAAVSRRDLEGWLVPVAARRPDGTADLPPAHLGRVPR